MENSTIIKNKYIIILKENKVYAYVRVKKDFYCEGYLLEEKCLIAGYFRYYDELNFFLLNNSMETIEHTINSLSIYQKEKTKSISITDIQNSEPFCLGKTSMDEYCHVYDREEICHNIIIKEIEDEDVIKDINYLIRYYIKNLKSSSKDCYDSLKNHRYGNLRELIIELKYALENIEDLEISIETINDLTEYLKTLSLTKEEATIQDNSKNRKKKTHKRIKKQK